ncbi:MAG: hypothetical protein BA861_03270 [Desulfobacterales bacterium S3730MH5]|nr:MAG: hypothetical protein BA861_03270 [Desulfobacterales bacterium S3730MH5]
MSIWLYGRRQDGEGSVTSVSIPYELIMVFLAMLFAMFAPGIFFTRNIDPAYGKTIFLVAAGFLMFALAKTLQFRRGVWFCWGMKQMPLLGKLFYVAGYVFMGFGIVLLVTQY